MQDTLCSYDLSDALAPDAEEIYANGQHELIGLDSTEDYVESTSAEHNYYEQFHEVEDNLEIDSGVDSARNGEASMNEDTLRVSEQLDLPNVDPGVEYDSDPELCAEQLELTEAVLQCRDEREGLLAESRDVSSQFKRLEVLLHAAQVKELAAEREAREEEENRERELDALAAEAMEVERLMMETSSDVAETTRAESRLDEDDLEGNSADEGAELEPSTFPNACVAQPEMLLSALAPSANDAIEEQESDIEIIEDESDEEKHCSPEGDTPFVKVLGNEEGDEDKMLLEANSSLSAVAENAECQSDTFAQAAPEENDVVDFAGQGLVSEQVPQTDSEDSAAHLEMRAEYLMLLERAGEQRRQLNDTLNEIKRLEGHLGLAADATVSTAQGSKARLQQSGATLKRGASVISPDASASRPLKYFCNSSRG